MDERTGTVHDYSRRPGVVHTEIMLPAGADRGLADRQTLWNQVEAMEQRKDAQLARSVVLALPHELSAAQRLKLTQDFVTKHFVSKGMVADVAIHEPVPVKGENPKNHHAHVLLTLRKGSAEGLNRVKTREWNAKALVHHWRADWSALQNQELARHGHEARVDHRTLQVQRQEALDRRDWPEAARLAREPETPLTRNEWNQLRRLRIPKEVYKGRPDKPMRAPDALPTQTRASGQRQSPIAQPELEGALPVSYTHLTLPTTSRV